MNTKEEREEWVKKFAAWNKWKGNPYWEMKGASRHAPKDLMNKAEKEWERWFNSIRSVIWVMWFINTLLVLVLVLGVGVNTPVWIILSSIPLIIGMFTSHSSCFSTYYLPDFPQPSCRMKFWLAATAPFQAIAILFFGYFF